jgi:hypothetical protein
MPSNIDRSGIALKAIQDQQTIIENQQKQIDSLINQIERLKPK